MVLAGAADAFGADDAALVRRLLARAYAVSVARVIVERVSAASVLLDLLLLDQSPIDPYVGPYPTAALLSQGIIDDWSANGELGIDDFEVISLWPCDCTDHN